MPVVAQPRRRTHQVAGVGGVGDRTRHDLLDAGLREGRDAHDRVLQALLEHVDVLAGEVEVVGPVDALHAVHPGVGHLVGADQQPVDLAAVVARRPGVAGHGRLAVEVDHGLHRLGDQVLVDHRHDRNVQPDHGSELGGVVTGRIDDMLAHDPVAVVGALAGVIANALPGALAVHTAGGGDDLPAAVGQPVHVGDHRVAPDLAAAVASPPGHGVGAARRVGPTVVGGVEPELYVAEVLQKGMALTDLRQANEMRLDSDLGQHGVHVAVPVDLVVGAGQPDGSAAVPAGRQPRLGLQAGVQGHRLLMDLRQVQVADEVGDQPGGVPRRPRRQLALLQQDGVGPALIGQVVQQAHPHGPAADDDAARLLCHGPSRRCTHLRRVSKSRRAGSVVPAGPLRGVS